MNCWVIWIALHISYSEATNSTIIGLESPRGKSQDNDTILGDFLNQDK